tara:strand:+ start:18813 stop:19766 length:954 start_codon:yes stop_codon:yes gene_type:complete
MIISRTPLRVSFVGGGTDMKYFYKQTPGSVISMAIDKYIYIIVKKRYDKNIVLNYSEREIVSSVKEIKHTLIKACLDMVDIKDSIEITSIADIPSQGSGLGSSSTFTVGLLNALFTLKGENLDQEELARLACKIEIDICNAPIGKQDQYGASIGGLKKITFQSNEDVKIEIIADNNNLYRNLENQLIIVNSNIVRSASEILEKQKKNISTNIDRLKFFPALVDQFEEYLNNQSFEAIYAQLDHYWKEKKTLVQSSVKKDLEKIYDFHVPEYCHSGKICGAGGGGYFMFFKKEDNGLNLKEYFDVKIDRSGSVIIYNN